MQNQEWKPRAIGLPRGMRPDWQPYASAIDAGIAVAVILSLPVCGSKTSPLLYFDIRERFSRISSATLVFDSRTSSANGAFGRHDRHESGCDGDRRRSA
jgi:hypothetical protein